jgi:hypothetical protein
MIKEASVTVLGGAGVINELNIITRAPDVHVEAREANFKSLNVYRLHK